MANGTIEAARIRAETARDVQASRERVSEKNAANELFKGLALGQQETLGKVWQEKSKSAQELRELRVKRTLAFAKAAGDYYRSRDSGSAAERMRTLRGLYDSALKNSVDIVDAAFGTDAAAVDRLKQAVPGFGTEGFDIRAKAKDLWAAVANEAKSRRPGAAGLYSYVESIAGSPSTAGFIPGDPVFRDLSELGRQRDRAFKEAQENDAKAKGFLQSFETWAEMNGRNPADPKAVDDYVTSQGLGPEKIPMPGSSVVDMFGKIAANPAQYELPFSDIDPLIKQAEEAERVAKEEFLGFKPEEPEEEKAPQPELTEREMLVGWLSRPDVQAWAQRQGFNLGTVRDITPEVQAEIDAGRYPQGMAVRGKLYVSAPDDMRAVRAAARQMGIDPQKNLFYRMGIGDRTRRGDTVVRVRTAPAGVEQITPVKPLAASVSDDGKVLLVLGEDGKFYESKDEGETFSLMTDDPEVLQGRMTTSTRLDVKAGLPPVSSVVRPEQSQEFTIREEGPLYGADTGFEGGVVGVDRTPGSPTFGQRVQIASSDIVQRERIGLAPVRQTVAEQIMFKGAQRAEKKRAAEEKKMYGDMARAGEGPKGEDRPVTEEERAESERTGAEIQAALDAMSEQERARSPEAIAALKAREGVLAVEYNNAPPGAREAIAQQLNATTAKRQAAERAQAAAPPAVPEQVGMTKPVEEMARTAGSVGETRRPTTLQGVPTIPSAEQVNVGAPASGLLRPATGGPITFEKPAGEAEGAKRTEDIDTTTKPPAQPSAQRAAFGAAARRRPAATPASAPATSTV